MAKNTTVYVVATETGTEEFGNLGKVAKFLGVKKITKADVEAGKYPEITLAEATEETPILEDEKFLGKVADHLEEGKDAVVDGVQLSEHTLKVIAQVEQAINDTPEDNVELFDGLCNLEDALRDGVDLTEEQAVLLTKVLTNTLQATEDDSTPLTNTQDDSEDEADLPDDSSDIEYPEVGHFKDEKAMKKYIKTLKDSELQEWCELEGAEWKHNDHESINRMRMAMAIKAIHFPATAPKKGKKSKSKYAQYSDEQLVEMALEHDVEVPDDKGDQRILRMYTIMALRKAGIIE